MRTPDHTLPTATAHLPVSWTPASPRRPPPLTPTNTPTTSAAALTCKVEGVGALLGCGVARVQRAVVAVVAIAGGAAACTAPAVTRSATQHNTQRVNLTPRTVHALTTQDSGWAWQCPAWMRPAVCACVRMRMCACHVLLTCSSRLGDPTGSLILPTAASSCRKNCTAAGDRPKSYFCHGHQSQSTTRTPCTRQACGGTMAGTLHRTSPQPPHIHPSSTQARTRAHHTHTHTRTPHAHTP